MSVSELSCYTLQSGEKLIFLKPVSLSATVGLSTRPSKGPLVSVAPTIETADSSTKTGTLPFGTFDGVIHPANNFSFGSCRRTEAQEIEQFKCPTWEKQLEQHCQQSGEKDAKKTRPKG